jgi:hypothetical protein
MIVGPPTDLTTFLASFDRKLTEPQEEIDRMIRDKVVAVG